MKYSTSGQVEQARDGSARKHHFAKINQWGSLLQLTNQKCTTNVKRTIKASDMALLLKELVESFAIAICSPERAHRL